MYVLVCVRVCVHANVSEWWLTLRRGTAICSPRDRNCSTVCSVEAGDACGYMCICVLSCECLCTHLFAPAHVCLLAPHVYALACIWVGLLTSKCVCMCVLVGGGVV